MDIRSAQRVACKLDLVKDAKTNGTSLEFGLLSGEALKAPDAWGEGRREMTEKLAAAMIFLLGLAEMVGTDLQEVVEAKLAINTSGASGQPLDAVPTRDASGAATVAPNRGKLVRDKIPQIIRSKGQEPIICTADTEEYGVRLRDKLREEVEEYLASDNDREELADILEVLYALARHAGTDQHELEKLRAAKAEKRGGFADRVIWFYNQQATAPEDGRIAAARSW
jgi:predicted house-cleaning noncanonical NTP pyrophosphatase (MazG superfamily)